MFWMFIALLMAISMAFILPALLKHEVIEDATREQNIAIAKEQLAELKQRFENNEIDKDNYGSVKKELEYALYNDLRELDVEDTDHSKNINVSNGLKTPSKSIDTWLILLLAPLIAVPVYLSLGNLDFTEHLDAKKLVSEVTKATMPLKADGTPDVEKITQQLKKEMERNPTDPKGWYMLGRAYMMINSLPEAIDSFDKSLALRPDLANTMLSLADALSMNNEGRLAGRPRELVKKALIIEPQNVTALWLSGMAASQEAEYQEAITQWQKVLPFIENKPEEKTALIGLIEEAQSRLTAEKSSITNTNGKEEARIATNQSNTIKLSISISAEFKQIVSPEDLVFIYAKAISGPPMPLAAVKKQVKDFPLELVLSDDMAMLPNLKLSSFKRLSVGARISRTGQAIPVAGDFFTEKTDVSLGDSISLEIDEIYKK